MALDQQSHSFAEIPPPPPPPKMDPHSSASSPDLPPTPSDYFNSRSPASGLSSPSRHLDSTRSTSPSINGTAGGLLTPPSPNPAIEGFNPPSPSLKAKQSKKSNPLTDLVDSEREYIDVLAGIIRKVAGAWSRTNFPPKQLDTMFRGIEAVYKANRGLLTRLKEIGPAPTSPKALGDLLMRWIDDLDAPYTRFCTNYAIGFDAWDPVVANTRLPPILATLSSVNPPPPALLSTELDVNGFSTWTLDALFTLPRTRLKYYKKLYTRLLKSTQPGRSDHKLLTGAVEKLESLLGILAERGSVIIGEEETRNANNNTPAVPSLSHSSLNVGSRDRTEGTPSNISGSETKDDQARGSVGSSVPPSSLSSEARASRDIVSSNGGAGATSSATMSMPISNLERRLCTDRVSDIFTLKPKTVRLQMNPPSLSFTRSLRVSYNVEVHFTPRAAPDSPRIHTRGHVFLLTDLFLVCEHMTVEEKVAANTETSGQDYDMWLLYPPLAGKHLRVSECPGQNNALQVQVLKKELLFLHTESKIARDLLIKEFKECIEEASLLSPRTGQPPPPMPPLKTPSLSPSDRSPESREPQSTISSETSPFTMSTSISISNSQPWDQSRPSGDSADASRHISTSSHASLRSLPPAPSMNDFSNNPNTDGGAGQEPGRWNLTHNAPQPQLQPLAPPESSTIPTSNPLPHPPRGPNNPQYQVDRQPGFPMRPATAPGHPQYRTPSVPPNFLPQMQNFDSYRPRPSSNGQLSAPGRPPSEPVSETVLRKSPSALSLGSSRHPSDGVLPPMPGYPVHPGSFLPSDGSVNFAPPSHVHQPHPRLPFPQSASFNQRTPSFATTSSWGPSTREPSPPSSPIDDPVPSGPVTSTITAQFKCKVFLQLHHGQWKSLGGGRLKLYLQQPTNIKQLVVEADSKDKAILISTIILTDGVERVGRTGVAIELSDKGARTGIIYMIQLRNENSASGLFDSLLAGSDRAASRPGKG